MVRFDEVWVDDIRQLHGRIPESENIWYAGTDGRMIQVACIILDILMPDKHLRKVTVRGTTVDSEHVEDDYLHGAEDVPPEIEALILTLLGAGETCPPDIGTILD